MNIHEKNMDNTSISSWTSFINSSAGYQGLCAGLNKEDNHIAQNINISSAILCSLIFLFGTTANGYVIWMKVYRLEKTFRSVLSLNCYISGFIWLIFLPLNIAYFASGDHWPFGTFMCQLNNFIFHLNMFVSAFILTLYSIDYCNVVLSPFKYSYHRRPSLASIESLISWITAFFFSIPYFVFQTTYDCHGAIRCLNKFDDPKMTGMWNHGQKAIRIIAFVAGYCIPLLIIFLCFVIAAVVYHRKKTSEYSLALKLIFTFQTLFGVSWLPYHVLSLTTLPLSISREKNLERVAEMVWPITISLASISCCVNPILYILISPNFKNVKPFYTNCWRHEKGSNACCKLPTKPCDHTVSLNLL